LLAGSSPAGSRTPVTFEALWNAFLALLAIILLISGIDDLVPILICVRAAFVPSRHAPQIPPRAPLQRRIAVFVPCWQEFDVIGHMLRHNIAGIKYRNFDFFVGTYPNDPATIAEVKKVVASFENVHLAMCSRPGPTCKADCLNSIYARMEQFEAERGISFDTVLLHDAEDVIHPDALDVVNRARAAYDMVQVPVLPLPTGFAEFTHGIYCDEFAEFQNIDMRARGLSGSFIPSNGVGTGFSRDVLATLARERAGAVFDPGTLTEDYEIGVRIHAAGHSQIFAPLRRDGNTWVATREYFPRNVRAAVRQRTRWVTGISLQCWQRVGWQGGWPTRYWFWRDRKGLLSNVLSLLANAVSLAGGADLAASALARRPWTLGATSPTVIKLCVLTMLLTLFRLSLRTACVARIYGPLFAAGVPLRAIYANFVNCGASVRAITTYVSARLQGRNLAWQKTAHTYPAGPMPAFHRRDLLEILCDSGCLSVEQASALRDGIPPQVEPAAYLLENGLVSEDALCLALSIQGGVQAVRVNLELVKQQVVRSLPNYIEERYGLVPFDMNSGRLALAGWLVPSNEVFDELKALTNLDVEFQLVRSSDYAALRELCYGLRLDPPDPRAGSNKVIGERSAMRHLPPLPANRTDNSALRSSV